MSFASLPSPLFRRMLMKFASQSFLRFGAKQMNHHCGLLFPSPPPLCVENRLEADATRSMNRCARLTALYNTSAGLFSRFHSGLKNFLLARHWINCFSSQRSLNNLRVYVGSWLNAKVKTVVWEIYYDQDITQLIKICLPQFCRSKWIHGSLSVEKRGKKGYRYVK